MSTCSVTNNLSIAPSSYCLLLLTCFKDCDGYSASSTVAKLMIGCRIYFNYHTRYNVGEKKSASRCSSYYNSEQHTLKDDKNSIERSEHRNYRHTSTASSHVTFGH